MFRPILIHTVYAKGANSNRFAPGEARIEGNKQPRGFSEKFTSSCAVKADQLLPLTQHPRDTRGEEEFGESFRGNLEPGVPSVAGVNI